MKNISFYFLILFILLQPACNKKDNFNYPAGTVGISKIVYYPAIAIKGDHTIFLHQGDSFTDPGVTATINGQSTAYTTTGAVDANTPGVYDLNYSAKNSLGYSAADWRTVVVIGNDIAANDFSGTYARTSNGVTSTWTKTAPGLYVVDNPGGAGVGIGYKVIVVNYQGNKIKIPRQLAADPSGNVSVVASANETYNPLSTPPQYSWVFLAGGYGTSLRTFKKQ